jgi:non-ribosomal peptide synthetase component E (peptide arylation enzyme)
MSKLGLFLRVSYVATIDKTIVGKINKKLLRERNPH